jgi:hypothetical protein
MIEKRVPDKKVIEYLTKEIKEFGLSFAKTKENFNMTKTAFDKLKDSIPQNVEIHKALMQFGAHDMERKDSENIKNTIDHLKQSYSTNTMYYSAGSCINWHTNSDDLGIRTYILYTSKPGIFRYKDPNTGEIIDDLDYVGWTQRSFKVDKDNLLWHCVYSPAPRFAYGFNYVDNP